MWEAKDNPVATDTARKKSDFTDVMARIMALAFIAFWVTLPFWLDEAKINLDESGWIPHSHDTPVWIAGDWLTGEYRICKMPLMPKHSLPSSAHLICGENIEQDANSWPTDFIASIPDHDFYELMGSKWDTVEQRFHVLPVRYWGRIDRKGQLMLSWRCQREASGLECKALN